MPIFRSLQAAAAAFLAVLGAGLSPAPALADEAGREQPQLVTLSNGLRVVLLRDSDAPVLSVCTAFDAGVRRDAPEAPGVARVVAELLRNGGRPRSGQDLQALVARRGGSVDVEVGHDALTYCTTVPAAELEFALWFEAGRFTDAALTQQALAASVEELSAEFERLDDQVAASRAPRRLRALAFQGRPAYARAALASSAQLAELELSQLKSFHRVHYGASQAVVAVVGDFEPAAARNSLENHLGSAPAGSPLPPFRLELPHQTTERFSMIEDPTARVPAVRYGWVLPELGDQERDALELVSVALTARLEASIVGSGRVAQSVESHLSGDVGPELLSIVAVGTGGASLEGIQKALDAELSKLGQFGLGTEELAAAQAILQRRRALERSSNLGRAQALSRGVLLGIDPQGPANEPEPRVSNASIARAVRDYLHSHRRTVIEIYPKGWSDPWQTPMPTYHLVSSGENLIRIASRHNTTVEVIAKMNGIDPKKPIYPGQKLKVPRGKVAAVKSVVHTVRAGDTLSGIAQKYKVTVQGLAEVNGIDPKRPIRPGDELRVPSGQAQAAGRSPVPAKSAAGRTHEVKAGDTLGGIARRYGVTTASLAAANGLGNKTTIRIGQKLIIPAGGSAAPAAPRGTDSNSKTSASRVHVVKAGETLGGIAKKHGVTIESLTRANGISRNKPIRIGQKLVIPR